MDARDKLYDEVVPAPLIPSDAMELRAERFGVERSRIQDQVVIVSKRVVTVRKTIEVDVSHEELVVERRAGDGSAMPATSTPDERFIVLYAEQVEVTKSVRAVERVRVAKRDVTELRTVVGTLRREELSVEVDSPAP